MTETKNESNYYFWIIVLLVIMIAAMAGLWVVEHKKLGRAMTFIKQNQTQQNQDGKLRDLLLNAEVEKNHILNRDNFVKKSVTVNGSPVDVFVVTYSDAVKAGLMEGDIIFVGQLPAEKTENNKTGQ